jgi:hypothetical protein
MPGRKKPVRLVAFLKGSTDAKAGTPGCSNFDHRYGGCLFQDVCSVQAGKRCGYFEKAVLPTGSSEIFSKYEAHCGLIEPLVRPKVRLCSCGNVLKSRQRYCEDCRRKRRRATYRKSRQRKAG